MEPDVAALSLSISPYHLAIPRSFYVSVVESMRSNRVKGVSPYGRSPHCLLSTDSLVPLLPITNSAARIISDMSKSTASKESTFKTMTTPEPLSDSGLHQVLFPSLITDPAPRFHEYLPLRPGEPPVPATLSESTYSESSQVWQPTPAFPLDYCQSELIES